DKLQWLLDNPQTTWSGSGIYALSLAVSAALAVASWCFWRKKKSSADNEFTCNGGEQNIGQGQNAVGKKVDNHGPVITIIDGVPFEKYDQVRDECERLKIKDGITDAAFASFFKILEEPQVPPGDLDSKLREFACQYKELKLRLQVISCDDPEVKALKKQADQAFENGRFSEVEELLDHIDERCDKAILQLHKIQAEAAAALEKQQLCKAENLVSRAKLQRLQYRYEKSAQYFQEAAAALPEGHKNERAGYLGAAGNDLDDIARYAEALSLYEQSLSIFRDIGDRQGEAKSLNNIGLIYQAQGEYDKSLAYLEQSLPIFQNFSDTESEGVPLNNIANIYKAKGDYPKALKYFEQSLLLLREINHKEGEGVTLDNIGQIYYAKSDYPAALQYYEQALAIRRETKDKHGESATLNNISTVCYAQEKYDAALELYEQSLTISHQIGDRRGEGATLNNIGMIYEAKGDYATALKYLEQAMAIAKEINDKEGQARSRWNIGLLYEDQGELAKSAQYLSQAMKLMEHLEHPMLQECREVLEAVRAKLRERQ
ncbi:tetratricopeptide repeat protein, partial [Desulfobulbus sp. F5]|nr:tetratricopeptide repeat protein [Desulfobulbus sp. F5]